MNDCAKRANHRGTETQRKQKTEKVNNMAERRQTRRPLVYFLFSLCLCVSVVSSSAFAQRDAKVPDPDPEIERKALQARRRFRGQPVRRRSAAGQADSDEFRLGRPLVGGVQRGVSADQARPESQRQDHRPRRPRRRRQGRQDHRLRRRAAHPDRPGTRRRRRLRRRQHGPAAPVAPGRRQGPAAPPRHPVRLRHRGHASPGPHAALGP